MLQNILYLDLFLKEYGKNYKQFFIFLLAIV